MTVAAAEIVWALASVTLRAFLVRRRRDSYPPAPRGLPPGSWRLTAPDQQIPHEDLNDLVTLIQRRAPERPHAAIRTRTGWPDLDDFSLYP